MAILPQRRRLKKELTLLNVYAIATGTTLSAGFFLLPGLAAAQIGSTLVLAYLIAALPLIPAMFSVVELATAMPRAGGIYYFLDRSLGSLVGTIGGIGTWLAVALKASFALVGMGAYLALFFPDLPIKQLAIGFTLIIGALCIYGAKTSGGFQVLLVAGLLCILAAFIGGGLPLLQESHFSAFFEPGVGSILSTAGFVYISYVGVTTVASLAEEVKDPERNLPLGVFLALGTAISRVRPGNGSDRGPGPTRPARRRPHIGCDRRRHPDRRVGHGADLRRGDPGLYIRGKCRPAERLAFATCDEPRPSRASCLATTLGDAARRHTRSCSPSGSSS